MHQWLTQKLFFSDLRVLLEQKTNEVGDWYTVPGLAYQPTWTDRSYARSLGSYTPSWILATEEFLTLLTLVHKALLEEALYFWISDHVVDIARVLEHIKLIRSCYGWRMLVLCPIDRATVIFRPTWRFKGLIPLTTILFVCEGLFYGTINIFSLPAIEPTPLVYRIDLFWLSLCTQQPLLASQLSPGSEDSGTSGNSLFQLESTPMSGVRVPSILIVVY